MTAQLQQFVIDGQTIWVEVEEISVQSPPSATTSDPLAGSGKAVATSAHPKAIATGAADELVKANIPGTLNALVSQVQTALDSYKPDEVTLEIALGIKGEVGVFVAKSEGNASLKISAKWKRSEAKPITGRWRPPHSKA